MTRLTSAQIGRARAPLPQLITALIKLLLRLRSQVQNPSKSRWKNKPTSNKEEETLQEKTSTSNQQTL